MLQKFIEEEKKNHQLCCRICFAEIENENQELVVLEECGHIYHKFCFVNNFEEIFENEIEKYKEIVGKKDQEKDIKIEV